ncbi:MAG: DNA repair protein RecO [Planctomycetota bacterium]|jgi:DNA repair protein RecO (recombination protein O)
MLTRDFAICVRALDYSETSQIVTFFTRVNGKIRAIAKGSKRPKSAFDGAIEVFSYGQIVFAASKKEKLATLTEFEQQPAFMPVRDNLFALNCCLFGTELLSNLTNDYDPHPGLFDSFLEFLKNTNELQAAPIENRDTLVLLILFQLALLKEVGLQPILNYCVNCKTKFENRVPRIDHQVYFSSSANGLVCRDCEASFPDKIRLSKNAAGCLTNLKTLAEANPKTLKEVEKVLIHHFTEMLHRPPKMAKHVLQT